MLLKIVKCYFAKLIWEGRDGFPSPVFAGGVWMVSRPRGPATESIARFGAPKVAEKDGQ